MIAGTLELQLITDIAKLRTDMQKATQIIDQSAKQMDAALGKVRAAVVGLASGLSIAALGTFIKGTIDAADKLNDLSKMTGVAAGELAALKVAAMQSGTDIDGLAKAMGKLSVEFGKDPDKFKKLGITATDSTGQLKQLADIFVKIPDISLRNALAQDVLGKSWQDLAPLLSEGSKGLEKAAEKGKRMAEVTELMAPAADELNDKWVQLTGSGGVLQEQVGNLLPLLNLLMDELLRTKDSADTLGSGFNPLAEALKVIAVLIKEVSFVLTTVAGDFNAAGNALTAWTKGDWSGAHKILDDQVKAAARARKEVDEYGKKVIAVGTALQSTADVSDATSRRITAATVEQTRKKQDQAQVEGQLVSIRARTALEGDRQAQKEKERANAAKAAAEKALADAKKQAEAFDQLMNAGTAQDPAFLESLKMLNAEAKKRNLTEEQYLAARKKLIEQQPFYIEQLKIETEIAQTRADSRNKENAVANEFVENQQKDLDARLKASREGLKAAQEELDSRGKLQSEIGETIVLRLQEEQAQYTVGTANHKILGEMIENQRKLNNVLRGGELREANEKAAADAAKAWESVGDAFVQNLMKGGKSVAQYLKDLFRTLVLNPILQPIGQALGSVVGGIMGSYTGGNGILGGIGNALGIGKMLGGSGMLGGLFGGGVGAAGAMGMGSGVATASQLGAGFANYMGGAGYASTAAAGGGLGGMGALGSLGVIGGVAAAAFAVYKMIEKDRGGPKVGGQWGAMTPNPAGSQMAIGGMDNRSEEMNRQFTESINKLNESFNKYAAAFGVAGGTTFGIGVSTDPQGTAPTMAEVTARNAAGVAIFNAFSTEVGRSAEALGNTITQMSTQGMMTALQASGIDARYVDYFNRITVGMDPQAQAGVLDTIASIAQFTNEVAGLGGSFALISNASVDARANFLALAGGIENATAMINSYFNNFYGEAEKGAKQLELAAKTLQQAGLSWATPEALRNMTRDQFKGQVEHMMANLDAPGAAGALSALLQVQQVFHELHPVADAAADSVADVVSHMEQLTSETKALEVELMRAQGNIAGVRAAETEGYTAAEVAVYDHNMALRAQIEATNAAKQAAEEYQRSLQAMRDETTRLQVELARAQGNIGYAQQLETQNMSAEQRAIYYHNESLRAQIRATQEAAAAAEEYARKLEGMRDITRSLQAELAREQGDVGRARQLEIQGMSWAEIQIYDYNESLKAQIRAVQEAKAAAEEYERKLQSLRDTTKALQIELARTQGNNAKARQLEIQGLSAAEIAIYDYNQSLRDQIDAIGEARNDLEEARQQVSESYNKESSAIKETISELEQSITRFRNFAKEMTKFRDSLLTGNSSPLSPQDRYLEASKQFQDTYAKAMTGDEDARGEIQNMANQFLELSRENFASGTQYTQDFNRVRAALHILAARGGDNASEAEKQLEVAKSQLEALNMMVEGIIELNINVMSLANAVMGFHAAQAKLDSLTAGGSAAVAGAITEMFAAWSSTKRYMPGERVTYSGSNYEANAASAYQWNENSAPERTPQLWNQIEAVRPSDNAPWSTTKRYLPGERAMRLGVLYEATALSGSMWNENSVPEWSPNLWQRVPGYALGTNYIKEAGLAFLHPGESVLTREQTSANSWRFDGSTLQSILAELRALRAAARENCEAQIQSNFEANDRAAEKVVEGTAKVQSRQQFVQAQTSKARNIG